MTEEKKEAIEKLEELSQYCALKNIDREDNKFGEFVVAIQKIKNLIQRQDRQIDLMAKYIACLDNEETICKKHYSGNLCEESNIICWECIKQYFTEQAKEVWRNEKM